MSGAEAPRRTTRRRTVAEAPVDPGPPAPETRVAETPPPSPLPLGRIAFALILLAVGVGWLLHSLDVIEVPWDALLPVALIAVGAVLVVGSQTGRYGGLIALGIVLTVLTALFTAVDLPLVGGVGERNFAPQSVSELEPSYDLAVGQMTLDLTQLDLSDVIVVVEGRVGMGELVVELPQDVPVEVHARAGLGDVQVLGEQASGVGPERTVGSCDRVGARPGTPKGCLELNLSVGMGEVTVNQ